MCLRSFIPPPTPGATSLLISQAKRCYPLISAVRRDLFGRPFTLKFIFPGCDLDGGACLINGLVV